MVFESQRLYDRVEIFEPDGVPSDYVRIPFGEAVVRRTGDDVTMLTIGPSLYPALDAASELSAHGIEAEIIDARTGRLMIVSEAVERGSFANTIAANVTRLAFAD